jgi:hypothetical protein
MVKILYYELNGFRLPVDMEATTFFLTLTDRESTFCHGGTYGGMVGYYKIIYAFKTVR